MICERCRIAGDQNKRGDVEAAKYNHDKCVQKDCMCQHRVGALVARGYEEEQVSSTVGDGRPDSENRSPS